MSVEMNVEMNAKISGEYRLVVTSADGTTKDTGWFPNLILNQGLNRLGDPAGGAATLTPIVYASIGTGTSTPIATQTALDAPVAYSSVSSNASSVTNAGTPTYATLQTFTYVFTQGSVIGNMSEVGVGSATSSGNLFSRALIVDINSNPTTITLTSLDQLTVYYQLTISPPLVDGTGTVVLNSISYNYTTRVCAAATFFTAVSCISNGGQGYFSNAPSSSGCFTYAAGASLGLISAASPTGTSGAGWITQVAGAYTANSFSRTHTATWTPSLGNETGGIQAIKLTVGSSNWSQFQIVFDKPIPKTTTTTLTLAFVFSWGR